MENIKRTIYCKGKVIASSYFYEFDTTSAIIIVELEDEKRIIIKEEIETCVYVVGDLLELKIVKNTIHKYDDRVDIVKIYKEVK